MDDNDIRKTLKNAIHTLEHEIHEYEERITIDKSKLKKARRDLKKAVEMLQSFSPETNHDNTDAI